jgi:hypothetical protein
MESSKKRHNLRYQDVKEVDLFLQQACIDKTISTITKTAEQQHTFEQLQHDQSELHVQLQQRKRASSSTSSSPIVSRNSSPLHMICSPIESPSLCPICTLCTSTETIVTWKECGHSKLMVPSLSPLLLPQPSTLSITQPPPLSLSTTPSTSQKSNVLPKLKGRYMA